MQACGGRFFVNPENCTKIYVEKYVDFGENSTCVFQKSVAYLAS